MLTKSSAENGNAYSEKVISHASEIGAEVVIISAQIESEMSLLDPDEQKEYLNAIGLEEPGLNRLIQSGYSLSRTTNLFYCRTKGSKGLDLS